MNDETHDPLNPPETPPDPEAEAPDSGASDQVTSDEVAADLSSPEPVSGLDDMVVDPAGEPLDSPVDGELQPEAIAEVVEAAIPAEQVDAALAAVDAESASATWSYDLPQALIDSGFDVEAALGALSFEHDDGADEDSAPSAIRLPPYTPSNYRPRLPVPSPIRVRRGQLGSLVPALALIGVGAWLTAAQVTGTTLDPLLVGAVLTAGLMLSFLAAWIGNGRWSRGLLLVVLLAVVGAGGGALVLNAGLFNALGAYPLLLSALGVAILITAFISRPSERTLLGPALVFITAGIVGYLVLNGAVPSGLLSGAAAYWFVPALILLILVALPLFFRRRA
ncbi:MAG: hypothetical protein U0452_07180 [Anaerolineae bacterium]